MDPFKSSGGKLKSGSSKRITTSGVGMSQLISDQLKRKQIEEAIARSQEDPYDRFNIPEEQREDYNLEPVYRDVSGIPIEFKQPKLKPEVGPADSDLLNLGRSQEVNLKKNIQDLIRSQNLRKRLSPTNLSAHSNWLGNIALSIESMANSKDVSEFTEFKARTSQLFQQYRKYITGVQAGFPELQMLKPIFPETTNPDSEYVSKALAALETIKINDATLLKALSGRGYRTRLLNRSEEETDISGLRQKAIGAGINVSGVDVDYERRLAEDAISQGKDKFQVAKRFKQRTGQEL